MQTRARLRRCVFGRARMNTMERFIPAAQPLVPFIVDWLVISSLDKTVLSALWLKRFNHRFGGEDRRCGRRQCLWSATATVA
jgi:hypothetical protein